MQHAGVPPPGQPMRVSGQSGPQGKTWLMIGSLTIIIPSWLTGGRPPESASENCGDATRGELRYTGNLTLIPFLSSLTEDL